MITFLRKALSSWIVLALLALVIVAFIITGVQDPFGGAGGGRSAALARVGDAQVTEREFQTLWQRFFDQFRQTNPQVTPEQAASQGAVEQLLDEIVAARALEQFALEQGITAGPQAVDAEIASVPAFQLGGRFDQATYEARLQQERISDRELRESLVGDLLRRQLLAPIPAGATMPRSMALPYARLILERRSGTIGVVPTEAMEVPQPSEAELKTFYNAQRQGFTLPERRAFRFALITPEALGARAQVSDADIQRYYAANPEQFGGVARRELNQAVLPDQAAAQRLVQRVRGGADFVSAAAQVAGLTSEDVALGELTQAELANATSAEVAQAAFNTPPGGVTNPVRSEFGWHVVSVEGASGGQVRPLVEVRPEIEGRLRAQRAEEALAALLNRAQTMIDEGANLTQVAGALGLEVVTTPPITSEGVGANIGNFSLDPSLRPLLAAAFETDAGEEPVVEELDGGRFALVETTEVLNPQLIPFAEARPAVEQALRQQRRLALARATAQAIEREIAQGVPPATAFAKRNLPPPQPVTARRIDLARQQGQIPAPVLLMFSLPEDAVETQPAPAGAGVFVVKVDDISAGDPAATPNILEETQRQFARFSAEELVAQFANAAQQEVGVERNPELIARTRAQLAGEVPDSP